MNPGAVHDLRRRRHPGPGRLLAVGVKVRDQGMGSLNELEQDIFEFELRPLIESFEQRKIEDVGREELERPK